jgi:hypothetical protein
MVGPHALLLKTQKPATMHFAPSIARLRSGMRGASAVPSALAAHRLVPRLSHSRLVVVAFHVLRISQNHNLATKVHARFTARQVNSVLGLSALERVVLVSRADLAGSYSTLRMEGILALLSVKLERVTASLVLWTV